MSARRRRWLVAGALVAAVAAVLWAGYALALPRYVERRIAGELERRGFGPVRLAVRELGPGRAVVDGLDLRGGWLRADRVEVGYDVAQLLDGRVGAVAVDGLAVEIGGGRGGAAPESPGEAAREGAATGLVERLFALPLERLEVRSARVDLVDASGTRSARGWARFAAEGANRLRGALGGTFDGLELALEGELRRSGDEAEGAFAARLGAAEPGADGGARPLRMAGTARLRSAGAGRVAIDARATTDAFDLGTSAWRAAAESATLRASFSAGAAGLALDVVLDVAEPGWLTLSRPPGSPLPAALGGLAARGRAEIGVAWPPSGPARAAVALRGASLRSADGGVRLDGLAGDVVFAGLDPPATPPAQRLAWTALRWGKVELGGGELDARLSLPDAVEIESLLLRLSPAGTVAVGPLTIDPAEPVFAAAVRLHEVPLDGWLELISRGRVRGEGTISGSVEIAVRTEPRPGIDIGAGRLAASGGGSIRVIEDEAVRGVIAQHVGAQQNPRVDLSRRILGALQDFAFEKLSFDFLPAGDDLTLRVHSKGQGRVVPQELDVTVNFKGFDDLVDVLIDAKLGAGAARAEPNEEGR